MTGQLASIVRKIYINTAYILDYECISLETLKGKCTIGLTCAKRVVPYGMC